LSGGVLSLDRNGMRVRLIVMVAISVLLSVVAAGAIALAAFDRAIEPEMNNRVRLIGSTVRSEIQRALELGIPLEQIGGLDAYLARTLDDFGEVDRISVLGAGADPIASDARDGAATGISDAGGADAETIAFRATRFELPIIEGNALVGTILVETNTRFVRTRLRQVLIDVVVIVLVALVVAMEIALAIAMSSIEKPLERIMHLLRDQVAGRFAIRTRPGGLGGLGRTVARFNDHVEDLTERMAALPARARERSSSLKQYVIAEDRPTRLRLSKISDIRIALFLFSVSTETAVAFLPIYARAAARPDWLSAEVAAALPLMVYLVATACLAPFAGPMARRFGARRIFLASVAPSAVALLAMGFVDNLIVISLFRGLMAISYATATIACQTYAIRAAEEANSTRPFGTFMAVIYGGVFCGSALGGLVAGRFGYQNAFIFGATMAVLSGIAGLLAMHGQAGDRDAVHHASEVPRQRTRLPMSFFALLAGVAIPTNATTAVFVWYMTPLMLASAGFGPAEIARVVMLYYLAAVVFGPLVSHLSDRGPGPMTMLIAGALLSAGAMASLSFWNDLWGMTSAICALGIGHTLIRAPQYAVAAKAAGEQGRGLDYLRFIERAGALAGLGIAALTFGSAGADRAALAMAFIVFSGIVFFAGAQLVSRPETASRGG